jgi:hypothetical protein
LSKDGKYTTYTISPHRGDGYLYIVNNSTGKKDSVFKGEDAVFSGDVSFVAFKITPGFDTLRACELKKISKEKYPKDSLGVYFLSNDSLIKVPKLKSFGVSKEGAYLFYLTEEKNNVPEEKQTQKKKKKRKNEELQSKSDGNLLTVVLFETKEKHFIINVTDFQIDNMGKKYACVAHKKTKNDEFQLIIGGLNDSDTAFFSEKFTSIKSLKFSHDDSMISFLASKDTLTKSKSYALYLANIKDKSFTNLSQMDSVFISSEMSVSENLSPYFTKDNRKILFGIAKKPIVEPKDSLLESEKAKLDLWHWNDDRLQTQQLYELKKDEKKSILCLYDFEFKKMVQVNSDTLHVTLSENSSSDYALGYSVKPYQTKYNWEYPGYRDYYRINLKTGEQQAIKNKVSSQGLLSPSGQFFTYFNDKNLQQYVIDLVSKQEKCVTCSTDELLLK